LLFDENYSHGLDEEEEEEEEEEGEVEKGVNGRS